MKNSAMHVSCEWRESASQHARIIAGLLALCGVAAAHAQGPAVARPIQPASEMGMQPAQPIAQPNGQPEREPRDPAKQFEAADANASTESSVKSDDLVTLSAFTEPVQLSAMVQMVASTLNINVTVKGDVPGTVVFQAPVPVKKSELLQLLDMLLEQQGWSISQDRFGIYVVAPVAEIKFNSKTESPTTRVFSTPNVRPSALKSAIDQQLAAAQGGAGNTRYTYLDELGLIVVTDTPRRLQALEDLIAMLLEEFGERQFIRLPLTHISAPVARERALQLIGQLAQNSGNAQQNVAAMMNQGGQPQAGGGGPFNNLGERLTIDPQGNALIFRGLPAEIARVQQVLTIIDVRNTLVPKQYFAGSAARQIADLARQRGLGEVSTISADGSISQGFQPFQNQANQFGQPQQNAGSSIGGPVMVVDEGRGTIIYYGTPEQQESLGALITELDIEGEKTTIRVYKLRNSKAVEVADLIQGLISETGAVGSAPLLPGGQAGQTQRRNTPRRNNNQNEGEEGDGTSIDSSAFVIANEAQNQIVVKARAGQQEDFERLIQQLDVRRPQVYIEARIVAVTADDRLRLSFENQLINANGTGGVLNSNFGLGSLPTTGQPLLGQKLVSGGLSGFTAAVIKSDQVPIIMRALANETDSRIISTPQLLVDDNTEATVASIDKIPVQSISRTDSSDRDVVSFDRSEEAGTKLTVKPQIADAGYLRLEYDLELSNFTSEGTATQPPSSQVNTLASESITVPDDSTVVVGGLVLDANSKTMARIPLLGKIPLLGALFGDTNKSNRQTVLYVFLTPRILRDPNFADLRLLTRGPTERSKVTLPENIPPLTPRMMEIIGAQNGAQLTQPPRVPMPEPVEPMTALPATPLPVQEQPVTTPSGEQAVRRTTRTSDEQNPD
jgi:type II secretion system protein D